VTRSLELFEATRSERLEVSGNSSQQNDLQIFLEEQELMNELVAESVLPILNLDVSDNNIQHAVEKISDWLEGKGGLWMD
jgi:nitrogen regulatory protein PII